MLQADAILLDAATGWPGQPLGAFSYNGTGKAGTQGGRWGRQVSGPEVTLFPCGYQGLEEAKEQGLQQELWGERRQQSRCQKYPSEEATRGSTRKAAGLPAGQV